MRALPLISIIVPIYNVGAYLDDCIRSIIVQTYNNIEIILVDDGSTDECPAICDRWADSDSRIQVIHKANGGLSDARNCGLDSAKGAFISFIDGDDRIETEFIAKLYEAILLTSSQISMCKIQLKWPDGQTAIPWSPGNILYNNESGLRALINDEIRQIVCNKLYARSVIAGIRFPYGKKHEDEFWSYQVLSRANRIASIDYVGYIYLQRIGSIMDNGFSLSRLDQLEAKCNRQEFLIHYYPSLAYVGRQDLLFFCLYLGQHYLLEKDRQYVSSVMKTLSKTAKKYKPDAYMIRKCKCSTKLWLILEQLAFSTTCHIRNLLKIGL